MRIESWECEDDSGGRIKIINTGELLRMTSEQDYVESATDLLVAVEIPAEAEAKLLAVLQKRAGTCKWAHDGDVWSTACKQEWTFIDAGPDENHMYYCHGCGKRIEIKEGGA